MPDDDKWGTGLHSPATQRKGFCFLAPQAADHEIMERVELLEPTLVRV